MKLPFAFATSFVFRLVLPGLILALALVPAIDLFLQSAGYSVERIIYVPIIAVVLGWLVLLLDMPIYMLFEGRRYWPHHVRVFALQGEHRRLARLQARAKKSKERQDRSRYVEVALQMAQFPLSSDGERTAQYPTRLGNLLAEYEQYPERKYGMDGVFYWYRIWIGLPKELREELDEHQALVDSAVFVSTVLFASSLMLLLYAGASVVVSTSLPPVVSGTRGIGLSVLLAVSGYLVYRISLPAHAKYGNFFKVIFDKFHRDFDIASVMAEVAEVTGDERFLSLSGREGRKAAWRYLQWNRVRIPGTQENKSVDEVQRNRTMSAGTD